MLKKKTDRSLKTCPKNLIFNKQEQKQEQQQHQQQQQPAWPRKGAKAIKAPDCQKFTTCTFRPRNFQFPKGSTKKGQKMIDSELTTFCGETNNHHYSELAINFTTVWETKYDLSHFQAILLEYLSCNDTPFLGGKVSLCVRTLPVSHFSTIRGLNAETLASVCHQVVNQNNPQKKNSICDWRLQDGPSQGLTSEISIPGVLAVLTYCHPSFVSGRPKHREASQCSLVQLSFFFSKLIKTQTSTEPYKQI